MEEITTRFEIVRLAVKMADHETISVQAKKLRDLSLDEDLNEIISLLESRNYRQALFLMKGYVSSLDDSFFNTPPPAPAPAKPKPKETTQEPQGLFDMMQPRAVANTINLDDMLRMTEESAEETIAYSEPDHAAETYVTQAKEEVQKNEAYLDIHKNRVENKTVKPFQETDTESLVDMTGSVVTDIETSVELVEEVEMETTEVPYHETRSSEEVTGTTGSEEELDTTLSEQLSDASTEPFEEQEYFEESSEEEGLTEAKELEHSDYEAKVEDTLEEIALEKETFVSEELDSVEEESVDSLENVEESFEPENAIPEHLATVPKELAVEESGSLLKEVSIPVVPSVVKKVETLLSSEEEENEEKALEIKRRADYSKDNRRYPPISYIDQKFRNMRHQFPQIEQTENGIIEEVKDLLKQVASIGYTENDIKDAIAFFQEKKAEGKIAEAAQMLLLAAASESKYAQLLLARELFKGEVLKADYPESFTQINRLAEHDYPEAICDLAQLYEYGYGIKKDKKTAQLLYEEAAEMGVGRAQKHVERFSNKKGILSSFFK